MFNLKSLLFLTDGFVLGVYAYKHKDKIKEVFGALVTKAKAVSETTKTESKITEEK